MAENINVKINIDATESSRSVKQVKQEMFDLAMAMQAAAKAGDKLKLEKLEKQFDELNDVINGTVKETNQYTKETVELTKELDTELKTMKGMRKEYQQLAKDLEAAAAAGDKISFDKIEAEMGQLRNDIKDTAIRMRSLDPGELLSGYIKLGQGAVGAYSSITAAVNLFGKENEELNAITAKSAQLIQLMIGLEEARAILIDEGGRAQIKALIETTKLQYQKISAYITEKLTITAVEGSTKAATAAQRIWNTVVAQNPLGLMAAAAVAVGLAIYGIVKAMKAQNAAQKEIIDAYAEQSKAISNEKAQLELYLDIAKDSNQSLETRRSAIKKINAISPEYLGNITLENINTKKTTKSIKDYNTALENKAKQQALLTITSEKYARILEIDFKNTVEYYKSLSLTEQLYYGTFSQYSNKLTKEKNQLLSDIDNISKSFNSMFAEMTPTVSDEVKKLRKEADKLWDEVIAGSQKSLDKLNELMGTAFTLQEINTVGFRDAIDKYISTVGIAKEETEELTDANNKNTVSVNNNTKAIDNYKGEMEKLIPLYQIYIDKIMATMKLSEEQTNRVNERVKQLFDSFSQLPTRPFDDTDERIETLKTKFVDLFRGIGEGLSGEDAAKLVDTITATAQQTFDAVRQIRQNAMNQEMEDEMTWLDNKYNAAIEAAEGNERKQQNLRERFAEEQAKLEKEHAKRRQKEAIKQAIINGAMSATSILVNSPDPLKPIGPLVIAQLVAAAAMTATQIATIKSQKLARGGVLNGPSHANGGIFAGGVELEGQEGVINKNSMSNPALASLASAVNVAGGGVPLVSNASPIIDYKLLAAEIGKVVNDKQVYVVESDITKTQNKVKVIESKTKF